MSLSLQVTSIFHKYVKNKFIRFVLVGGINTLFGIGVYTLMIYIGTPYIWAALISHVLGVLFNFVTTGRLVFENHDKRLIFKFVISYLFVYFINISINKFCQIIFGWNDYIAGICATILAALCSFMILKYFVFKTNDNEKD